MTFVELVDMLRQEAGASGDEITTVSEVYNLPGETRRLRNWIKDAWNVIQMKEKWNFLRYEASCIVPQYASIVIPDEFAAGHVADWTDCTAKIAKSADPPSKAEWMMVYPYGWFMDGPGKDPTRRGRPSSIAVDPRLEQIHIAPAADQEYRLYYDYWATPQELEADSDEPIFPKRFHKLIVWEALRSYGGYEAASEAVSRGQAMAAPLWVQLYRDQLPTIVTRHGF